MKKDTFRRVGLLALMAALAAGIVYLFYQRNKKDRTPRRAK